MSDTPIQSSLEKILKDLPSTGRGFAETVVTLDGWKSEIGHRISPNWKVSAFAGGKWTKKPEAGLMIRGSW